MGVRKQNIKACHRPPSSGFYQMMEMIEIFKKAEINNHVSFIRTMIHGISTHSHENDDHPIRSMLIGQHSACPLSEQY